MRMYEHVNVYVCYLCLFYMSLQNFTEPTTGPNFKTLEPPQLYRRSVFLFSMKNELCPRRQEVSLAGHVFMVALEVFRI